MSTERTHQCLLQLLKCAMKMGFFVKFLSHTRSVDQENVGLMCDVMRHKLGRLENGILYGVGS